MEQKIKWIIFDLSGVIVKFTFVKPEGYTIGSRFFSAEQLDGFFTSKDHHEYALGTLSHEQIVSRFIARKKLDISVAEIDEIIKNDVELNPGMIGILEKLSQTYSLALATNGGKEVTRLKIEQANILSYLSKVVASYRIRALKPDVAFYKTLLAHIGAKPEECVFIDDEQRNINTANSLGMKGILFTNTDQLTERLHQLQLI